MGEQAAAKLEMVLGVEVEGEYFGGGEGNPMALGATGFLTQKVYPSGEIIVDARNGFIKLSHLSMLCMLWNIWPEGGKFALNFYNY